MSRNVATHIRSLALATLTLAAVTACQNDGPTEPGKQPGSAACCGTGVGQERDNSGLVKIKPTLYFNGILFAATHGVPGSEIYSINPDGSSLFRLTTDTVTDGYPDVSPNGPAFIWARFSPNGQTTEIY